MKASINPTHHIVEIQTINLSIVQLPFRGNPRNADGFQVGAESIEKGDISHIFIHRQLATDSRHHLSVFSSQFPTSLYSSVKRLSPNRPLSENTCTIKVPRISLNFF